MHGDDEFRDRTLLVTGGAGFLGRTVVAGIRNRFSGRIISVRRGPHRPGEDVLPPPHREVRADLLDPPAWRGLLHDADYVLWMAAMRDHTASMDAVERQNVAPMRTAVAELQRSARLRRFVYTSSISAVDQPPHPQRPRVIDDDATPEPSTPYGYSKLAGERIIAGSGLPHTTLRLPFLYGPHFRRQSFLDFYRWVATMPVLGATRFTGNLSLLHTGDAAGLVLEVIAARNARAADASPYVVSDGHRYDVEELINIVARLHGRPRPGWRTPAALSRTLSELLLAWRAWQPRGPLRRGQARLTIEYWSHAAFTRDYFVVDPGRFLAAFPACAFTPMPDGLANAFGVDAAGPHPAQETGRR